MSENIAYTAILFFLSDIDLEKQHHYVWESLEAEVRARASDRTQPGPISCSADVLPFNFCFNIRPHQYHQYQKLQTAIKSQQRFDTMLHQRPNVSPMENPRTWWKYVMACVTSRPNSRRQEECGNVRGKWFSRWSDRKCKRRVAGSGRFAADRSSSCFSLAGFEEGL
jgi:Vacuolar sorting-associated protein 13, N-terminal